MLPTSISPCIITAKVAEARDFESQVLIARGGEEGREIGQIKQLGRLAARAGGVDGDAQIVLQAFLSDEVAERLRPERAIEIGVCRSNAPLPRRSGFSIFAH